MILFALTHRLKAIWSLEWSHYFEYSENNLKFSEYLSLFEVFLRPSYQSLSYLHSWKVWIQCLYYYQLILKDVLHFVHEFLFDCCFFLELMMHMKIIDLILIWVYHLKLVPAWCLPVHLLSLTSSSSSHVIPWTWNIKDFNYVYCLVGICLICWVQVMLVFTFHVIMFLAIEFIGCNLKKVVISEV